jgi:protein phosphatase
MIVFRKRLTTIDAERTFVEMEPATPPRLRVSVHLDVAARTDVGLEREGNEDCFLVIEPSASGSGSQPGWAVMAICDGMGGGPGGEVASSTAVEVLREVMSVGPAPATDDAVGRRLLHGVEEAARRVHAASCADDALKGMGTTATACALAGDALYMAQVGDSRAYLLREGRLTQLTRDQTLAELMLERGQITPEEVPTFPYGHVILQAVGTTERVDVDLTRVRVARGDVLLVCSDGLHGLVPDDTLRAALAAEPSPTAACEALVSLALQAGGHDNITCIVARVGGDALPAPSGPPEPEKATLDADATEQITAQVTAAAVAAAVEEEEVPQPTLEEGVLSRLAAIFRRRRASRS